MRRGRHYKWDAKEQRMIEVANLTVESKSPTIIPDTINKRYCDADGKWHESRSAESRAIKESGSESMGWNEHIKKEEPNNIPEIERDMAIAMEEIRYGQADLNEWDKHYCKETNERIRRKP